MPSKIPLFRLDETSKVPQRPAPHVAGLPNSREQALHDVRLLASMGCRTQGLAQHFNVTDDTFTRWMEEDAELAATVKAGREDERFFLHNVLYRKAAAGDAISAMFLLKARHGYREGDQAEQSNRVAVVFNLPGALQPDQYRTLEAVASKAQPKNEDQHAD